MLKKDTIFGQQICHRSLIATLCSSICDGITRHCQSINLLTWGWTQQMRLKGRSVVNYFYWSIFATNDLQQHWQVFGTAYSGCCMIPCWTHPCMYVCLYVYRGLTATKWSSVEQTWPSVSTTGGAHEILGAMEWCHCDSTWWGEATRCIFDLVVLWLITAEFKHRRERDGLTPTSSMYRVNLVIV